MENTVETKPKFRLTSFELLSYGERSFTVNMGLGERTPDKVVEAKNVAELIPLMDAFEAEMKATGKAWMLSCTITRRGQRKPPGFDKATASRPPMGPLCRFINTDKCPEKAII